jgi:hypothetical protein
MKISLKVYLRVYLYIYKMLEAKIEFWKKGIVFWTELLFVGPACSPFKALI